MRKFCGKSIDFMGSIVPLTISLLAFFPLLLSIGLLARAFRCADGAVSDIVK